MAEAALSLSCPCENLDGGMLGVEEALARLCDLVSPVHGTEMLELSRCAGRVVADSVLATHPMPFFDNSAMDGFAVSLADFAETAPYTLPVSAVVAAGDANLAGLSPGCCARIFTGAPIPDGADAVVPFEQVTDRGECAVFSSRPGHGAHIRRMGSDIARDDVLVFAGTRIFARQTGLLAANGYSSLTVYRRPRVGVFSTGDELVGRDQERRPWELHDANLPMMLMMLKQMACDAADLGIIPDDSFQLQQFFIQHAGSFDLLISSGAVSVGGRDFLKSAFSAAGGTVDNWKVALKPGKPVMFGRIGTTAFLGLPGNPMAAWLCFQLFGRPAVDRISGAASLPVQPIRAVAEDPIRHKPGRREYIPVRVVSRTMRGQPLVACVRHGGSASLQPLCRADGVVVIKATVGDLEAREELDFLPFMQGVLE